MKRITLTKGQVAIVDDDVFEALNQFNWYAYKVRRTYYAARNVRREGKQVNLKMHREVFRLKGLPVPASVDHRDRDGLNNRLRNLRPATHQQQQFNKPKRRDNTSGYIGVTWYSPLSKWKAQAYLNGKNHYLGYYTSKIAAARARDKFARKHQGQFAVLNFPKRAA